MGEAISEISLRLIFSGGGDAPKHGVAAEMIISTREFSCGSYRRSGNGSVEKLGGMASGSSNTR